MFTKADLQAAEQLRRALQMFAGTLPEEQALEVATVFPAYQTYTEYKKGQYITDGVDQNGDPCLYRVEQTHTSQADWTPESTPSLYTRIGLTADGWPVWSQPTGAQDAYNTGDIVDFGGTLYQSIIDGNVWSPDAYPAGWEIYEEV